MAGSVAGSRSAPASPNTGTEPQLDRTQLPENIRLSPGGARSAAFHKACPGPSSTRPLLRGPCSPWGVGQLGAIGASKGSGHPASATGFLQRLLALLAHSAQPGLPRPGAVTQWCHSSRRAQAHGQRALGPAEEAVLCGVASQATRESQQGAASADRSWGLLRHSSDRRAHGPGITQPPPAAPASHLRAGDPAAMAPAGWPRHTAGELFSVGKRVRARSLRVDSSVRPPRT